MNSSSIWPFYAVITIAFCWRIDYLVTWYWTCRRCWYIYLVVPFCAEPGYPFAIYLPHVTHITRSTFIPVALCTLWCVTLYCWWLPFVLLFCMSDSWCCCLLRCFFCIFPYLSCLFTRRSYDYERLCRVCCCPYWLNYSLIRSLLMTCIVNVMDADLLRLNVRRPRTEYTYVLNYDLLYYGTFVLPGTMDIYCELNIWLWHCGILLYSDFDYFDLPVMTFVLWLYSWLWTLSFSCSYHWKILYDIGVILLLWCWETCYLLAGVFYSLVTWHYPLIPTGWLTDDGNLPDGTVWPYDWHILTAASETCPLLRYLVTTDAVAFAGTDYCDTASGL